MSDIVFDKEEILAEPSVQAEEITTEKMDNTPLIETLEKIDISLDMTDEDIVSYNQSGADLYWDYESFREISPDTVRELNPTNKQRYMLAYGEWKFERDHSSSPIPKDITVSGRMARATSRLEVGNKDPNKHYSWQPPDLIREMRYRGYEISNDPSLDTFNQTKEGTHIIGIQGNVESVLMETSKENFEKLQRADGEKSRERAKAVEDIGAKDITGKGGIAYRPDKESKVKGSSRNFS